MKNINPLELHVEKLVLGIGVLFAIWLAYKNFAHQPNMVPSPVQPGSMVTPSEVGPKIIAQVHTLEQAIADQRSHPANVGQLPDYVKRLTRAQSSPLAHSVVAISSAPIGPLNMPLTLSSEQPMRGLTYMVPSVPPLSMLPASQSQAVVDLPATGNGNSPTTKGLFWVTLHANFPMAQWMASLHSKDITLKENQSPLPLPYRITAFYRVQVCRQRLLADGRWTAWKQIKGLYLDRLPMLNLAGTSYGQRNTLLGNLNSMVDEVLDPAFYATQVRQGTNTPAQNAAPQPVVPQNVQPRFIPGRQMPPGFLLPGGRMPPGMQPPQPFPQQQPPISLPAPGQAQAQAQPGQSVLLPPLQLPSQEASNNGFNLPGANVGNQNAAPASLTDLAVVPVRFYDTNVTPDSTYRYKIRVIMYNPVFAFPRHVNKPALRRVQWLISPWSAAGAPIHIKSDLYFYITSTQLSRGSVSFRFFKWIHGQWLAGSQTVQLGESIGNEESLSVVNGTGSLALKTVNFSTGYTLVDAVRKLSNHSVNVVLAGPNQNLHWRNSANDDSDPQQQKLLQLSNENGAPSGQSTGP